MIGPEPQALIDAGGQTGTKLSCEGEWWRFFVSIFLHAGLIHLVFNLLSLWQIGSALEKDFGTWQVAMIYSLSGITGQLASAVFLPDVICIGASGAIYGLFGATWADFLQNVAFFPELEGRCTGFIQMSLTTVLLIAFTLIPWVNAFAHLTGFITGTLLGYVLLIRKRVYINRRGIEQVKQLTCIQKVLMGFSLLFILAEILVFAVLFGEDDAYSKCEWCEYLECFETPAWDCGSTRVASCSYTLDSNTGVSQILCLDESVYDFSGIPTASDCFVFCGSDSQNCT